MSLSLILTTLALSFGQAVIDGQAERQLEELKAQREDLKARRAEIVGVRHPADGEQQVRAALEIESWGLSLGDLEFF